MSYPDNFRAVVTLAHPTMTDVLSDEGVETWLPILGPTAMLLAQRLVRDDGGTYVTRELASEMGVGASRLWLAVERLEKRQLVTVEAEAFGPVVGIRNRWPNPPARWVKP
jgi:hypothetical protein